MSIVVGKRNYIEHFGNMKVTDFPLENYYQTKMVLKENAPSLRNFCPQINQERLYDNLKILHQNFPYLDKNEVATVFEDCDYNLEIAAEILQESSQANRMSFANQDMHERAIKKIQPQKKNNNTEEIKEERKSDSAIQEEDPNIYKKMDEAKHLAGLVMDRFGSIQAEDAKDFLVQVFWDLRNEVVNKNQVVIKKLEEDKAILLNAVAKRKNKVEEHVHKVKKMTADLTRKQEDIKMLNGLISQNELRIQALGLE